MTKVYYNPRTRQCEGFLYGGCGGNENNFDSVQECLQRCGGASSGGKYISHTLFLFEAYMQENDIYLRYHG